MDLIQSTAKQLNAGLFPLDPLWSSITVISVGSFDAGQQLSVCASCSTSKLWSVPRCTGSNVISHTSARSDYQLITTNWCSKHGMVYPPFITMGPGSDSAGPGNVKLQNWSGPVFLWIVLTLTWTETGDSKYTYYFCEKAKSGTEYVSVCMPKGNSNGEPVVFLTSYYISWYLM